MLEFANSGLEATLSMLVEWIVVQKLLKYLVHTLSATFHDKYEYYYNTPFLKLVWKLFEWAQWSAVKFTALGILPLLK